MQCIRTFVTQSYTLIVQAVLEQLILEPTRRKAILNLVLIGTEDLVQEVTIAELFDNTERNVIISL